MKRKYKKTKKEHARRNATIKRRKRTRRQHGGAYIQNLELPEYLSPVDKREYNVIETDYYGNGSIMYSLECKAKAIVLAVGQACGASMCPRVDYRVLDGPVILKTYEPNGNPHRTYVGNFEDGKMHGHGKYTFHTHPVFQEYEGDFNNGEMHGKGRMMMKNEDVYVGDFQHDLMHGRGALRFTFKEDGSQDGSRYEGDFDNGRMHGHGKMHDDEGNVVFDGEFINNEPQYKVNQRKDNPGGFFEP